ncbi:GL13420 [Drosophila persimilis]|uniref:GL13420 n=1 Tax=Drosophila persimilis TaxID=7234 RepID=B4H2X9_DROPE|nr:GL13420 [Drosophila persimilis]
MSWLNNSLNSIKGQLTNLAQEVLADTAGPGDEDYRGADTDTKTALDLLAESQHQKEQLDQLCGDKDREIAALRRQITKLNSQQIGDGFVTPSSSAAGAATTAAEPLVSENDVGLKGAGEWALEANYLQLQLFLICPFP